MSESEAIRLLTKYRAKLDIPKRIILDPQYLGPRLRVLAAYLTRCGWAINVSQKGLRNG